MKTLKHATDGVELSNNAGCGLRLKELEVLRYKQLTFKL
jgi:hypothetical protein